MRHSRDAWLGLLFAVAAVGGLGAGVAPPKNPAKVSVDVSPASVTPGGRVEVRLRLAPIEGVRIARYPQIKLSVPAREGLNAESTAAIGSATPPPEDQLESNYWATVDPLLLTVALDAGAKPGRHELEGKLTYFFCVSKEFCAPARVPVTIPIAVAE